MTDIQAAIGLAQLQRLEGLTAKRQANAAFLSAGLHSVATPKTQAGYEHVWHQYTVRVTNGPGRDAAVKQLREAGIDSGIYYPVPVHKQQSMAAIAEEVVLPVSERMADQVMSLPVHPQLSLEDLETIVTEVNKL